MKKITTVKVKPYFLSVIASLIILLVLSCQKNDPVFSDSGAVKNDRIAANSTPLDAPRADDYQVRGGTLYFKDGNAFLRVHQFLARGSHNDRLTFAQAQGFKSLLAYQHEFDKACEVAKDEASFYAVMARYADIASLEGDTMVSFTVQSPLLASYSDRSGVLYIGQALYKFGDKDQTIVLDGDRAKLDAPESAIVKHILHQSITMKGARRSTTCSYIDNKYVTGDNNVQSGCDQRQSKLAVIPQMNTVRQGNSNLYTTTLTPYALAFPFKKNGFGKLISNFRLSDKCIFNHNQPCKSTFYSV